MNKESLHKLRLIIPGIIILLYILIPHLKGPISILELKISTESVIYIVIVFFIGGLYYWRNPRKYLMRVPLKRINDNIINQLLHPFKNDPEIKDSISTLMQDKKIMNVFYFFIDNEKSLSERAKEVYFNGLIWTSAIDLTIISPLIMVIYLIEFFVTKNPKLLIVIFTCFAVFLVSAISLPGIVERHIYLSNDQLKYIVGNMKKELRKKIIDLLS